MGFNKKVRKYLSAAMAAAIVSSFFASGSVYAESSDSIRRRLQEQELQAQELEGSLNNAKNTIDSNKSRIENLNSVINNYSGALEDAKAQSQEAGQKLEELRYSKSTVAEKIAILNEEIQTKVEKINKLETEIISLKEKIKATEKKIKELEAEVKKNTKLLEERLVVMYKKGAVKDIEVLLAAEDVNDFLSRQTMMTTITNHDKKLIAELRANKNELDAEKVKLNGEKTALEIANENTKKEKLELEKDKKVQDQLYEELRVQEGLKAEEVQYLKSVAQEYENYLSSSLSNRKELSNEISRKEAEIADLESSLTNSLRSLESTRSELRDAEAAEQRARELEEKRKELEQLKDAQENQNNANNQGPYVPSTGSGYAWPTAASYITSTYGWRYLFGGPDFHTGLDVAGPLGTDIYASKSGVVTFSGWNYYGYGNLVILSHPDGTETYYAHLTSSYVSAGQSVSRGETIAAMGTTGRSTGSHLHFEIRIDGQPVDPLPYLR
ncbi:MAG: peptidoglycan DD-metalloendopeptidase family protein [Tissierellia bacterium]|nr:peptidoglycan DD-metalloendopeptidase family protein [Tissierellia bacterium]